MIRMSDLQDEADVEDLVRQARTGSAAAFGRLVARYESPLYNFLLARVRSAEDAEDIAQEAFVRAWQRIDTYDPRWRFSTWLFSLARNLAATRQRLSRATPEGDDALARVGVHADPARQLADTEERESIWATAARVLDEDQRSALWLRYADGLAVQEVAEILGRSSVSVRVMLHRARAKLARHFGAAASERREPARVSDSALLRKVGT
jgi:RNA polymerase sigma-70 factor (ECF subfamily)